MASEYALTVSLSHSKRLPIAEELYANGIHQQPERLEPVMIILNLSQQLILILDLLNLRVISNLV
ncbi:MAG: hypothetical protein AB8W37_12215 [Arsenophonus endosymbiont of Dermacentor nuttalli]